MLQFQTAHWRPKPLYLSDNFNSGLDARRWPNISGNVVFTGSELFIGDEGEIRSASPRVLTTGDSFSVDITGHTDIVDSTWESRFGFAAASAGSAIFYVSCGHAFGSFNAGWNETSGGSDSEDVPSLPSIIHFDITFTSTTELSVSTNVTGAESFDATIGGTYDRLYLYSRDVDTTFDNEVATSGSGPIIIPT